VTIFNIALFVYWYRHIYLPFSF